MYAGTPKTFEVEPSFDGYNPDVFMVDSKGNKICVEVQLTPISSKKMKTKVEQFCATYKQHQSKVLMLCTNQSYGKVTAPEGFHIVKMEVPREVYSK